MADRDGVLSTSQGMVSIDGRPTHSIQNLLCESDMEDQHYFFGQS